MSVASFCAFFFVVAYYLFGILSNAIEYATMCVNNVLCRMIRNQRKKKKKKENTVRVDVPLGSRPVIGAHKICFYRATNLNNLYANSFFIYIAYNVYWLLFQFEFYFLFLALVVVFLSCSFRFRFRFRACPYDKIFFLIFQWSVVIVYESRSKSRIFGGKVFFFFQSWKTEKSNCFVESVIWLYWRPLTLIKFLPNIIFFLLQ